MRDFQFLILGYVKSYAHSHHWNVRDLSIPHFRIQNTNKQVNFLVWLSIPHFRIPASASDVIGTWITLSIPHFRILDRNMTAKEGNPNSFQFLILGYWRLWLYPRYHCSFQFLILGYSLVLSSTSGGRSLSIPHFRIHVSAGHWELGLLRTFNSSF